MSEKKATKRAEAKPNPEPKNPKPKSTGDWIPLTITFTNGEHKKPLTPWQPDAETRSSLESLKRDFRDGLSKEHPIHAVRFRASDDSPIPWTECQYWQLPLKAGLPVARVHIPSAGDYLPADRVSLLRLGPAVGEWEYAITGGDGSLYAQRINDFFVSPAGRVLWELRESGYPEVGERKHWHQGREWLRLVFALIGRHTAGIIEDCVPVRMNSTLIDLRESTPFTARNKDDKSDDPWGGEVAFTTKQIQVLTTDLMLASANAIDWLLREAKLDRGNLNSSSRTQPPTLTVEQGVAVLDGVRHGITDSQSRVLLAIIDANGGWVSGSALKQYKDSSERPDRIINGLPQAIRQHIVSKPGLGYRLTI